MANDNELEIILKLQDNVTKEFKRVTDSIKKGTEEVEKETEKLDKTSEKTSQGMVKGFKSQIKPMNEIIRTASRVGIIWGITFGAMIKGVTDLGKEIDRLDKASVKLGISASDLSNKIYGFDITTQQSRTGVASMSNLLSTLGNALTYVKLKTAETIAENDIFIRQYQGLAQVEARLQMLHGVPQSMITVRPAMSREQAQADIQAEHIKKTQGSPEGIAMQEAEIKMARQLSMSKVEIRRQEFEETLVLMQQKYADTTAYERAFEEQEGLITSTAFAQLKADRLTAEGDTTGALEIEHRIQLANFSKLYKDEDLIKQKAANLDIVLKNKQKAARLAEFQGYADGLANLSAAMTAYAGENKKAAKTAAVVQLSSTIVNTAASIMQMMATPAPANLALAALAAATGAIQIATISGQSFALGGRPPIGQASLVGERGPEMFVPDEVGSIIPNNKLGNTTKQISIYIEINEPTVRNDEDIDRITEQVSLRLAQEAERL